MEIHDKVLPEKLIEFSGEHLYYEIWMLYGVTEKLLKGGQDEYVFNALLESFVIHASIIIDFFYRPQVYGADARAIHYIADRKKWKESLPSYQRYFKKFHTKRNKEVVHLSFNRLEVRPEERPWNARQIIKQIRKIVDLFLDQADPRLLHPKIYELRTRT
jgi:hypothetical protein